MESLFTTQYLRTRWTLFFKFRLEKSELEQNASSTYKIGRWILDPWSLICLPAWLLNKSYPVFFLCECTLQLAFGKLPGRIVLVYARTGRRFFLELRFVNNFIGHCISLGSEELCSFATRSFLPVNISMILGWSRDKILCYLSLFSKHASLGPLLLMCLDWQEILNGSFWIVTLKAESWYSQNVIDNVSNCKVAFNLILLCIWWVGPFVFLLSEYLKIAWETTNFAMLLCICKLLQWFIVFTTVGEAEFLASTGHYSTWTEHIGFLGSLILLEWRHARLAIIKVWFDAQDTLWSLMTRQTIHRSLRRQSVESRIIWTTSWQCGATHFICLI